MKNSYKSMKWGNFHLKKDFDTIAKSKEKNSTIEKS